SLCYQLPAVHGGERLHGLTVVISPLQALMADQVRALSTRYPPSCFINSSLLMEERSEHLRGLRTGKYNVLYIGPEQLRNPSMVSLLRNRPPFLWVVDEAHCISQWGHNFRTDYTYLPRAIRSIHPHGRLPLLALFTATATADVRRDIATQIREALGVEIELLDFGARRDNLRYEVVACRDGQHKMNELVAQLRASESAGGARLVYCATTRQVADCVEMLKQHGIASAMYHGQLAPADKREQLERFLSGETDCIVATSAFGMGIDKPDIRLVVHYEIPGSLEDYVQETGRAGRDGEPARCVLLFQEEDLDIQFFLKSASRIADRDLRYVFKVLRSRAKRFRRHAREDGWVDLWVGAEDLFVEESLEDKLAWSCDTLHHKLKLVLHHLEEDGVLFRLENRTRTVGIFPRLASEEAALAVLQAKAADPNPVARRVLRYLYDPERPRRVSALDIADACGIAPRRAFEQVQALTAMGIVGQDLAFEVTLAHGVAKPSKELAHQALRIADALFTIGDDLDDDPVIRIRSAAAEIGRQLGQRVPPHRLVSLLRALRRHGLLQLDKFGPDLYRVRFDPSAITARDRLRRAQRVAGALFEHLGERLGSTRGRDLVVHLDINDFVERPTLTEKIDHEETVATCLLLHHLEAWHLADPPVLFDTAMRVRVDPKATLGQVDMGRPARHHQHEIQLVHMMREYAVTQPSRRQRYVDDYFRLRGEVMAEMYFRGRKLAIQRPVSAAAEARIVEGLTPAQREAVVAEEPAVLVVAGPGSGKTHTLVRRIVHMVVARQIRADQILVLAFNRSAAAELRARLDEALGTRGSWVDVRTFHSLAVKLTSADLFDRQGDADPDARLDEAMAEAAELLAATDEDDRERATHVRNQVLGGVRHVLVDEYQDLDPSQYALLAALVGLDAKKRGLDRTERSVYVVGDDDQAIYGFRNADVYTYVAAREELENAGGQIVPLDVSYRSTAPFLDALNLVLSRDFFTGVNEYPHPVRCGRPELRLLDAAGGDAPPIALVHLVGRPELRAAPVARALADFVARENQRVLGGAVCVQRGEGPERLSPSAVHVLCRSRADAESIGVALTDARVPHAFYKQEGLFATPAARHVWEVLRAIEDPSDRVRRLHAWLTPFFAVPLSRIEDCRELPPDHPLQVTLRSWRALADAHRWSELFGALLYDSGLVRRELFAASADRDLTDYQHVLEVLLEETHHGRRSPSQLVARLGAFIAGRELPAGESGDVQRLESEQKAVQILTMHKSKGLEAEVVFLVGGLSEPGDDRLAPCVVHDDEGERVAWLGDPPSAVRARIDRERREEAERLVYVAMTRAKSRLYVPYFGPPPPGTPADPQADYVLEAEPPPEAREAQLALFLDDPELPAVPADYQMDRMSGPYRVLNERLTALVSTGAIEPPGFERVVVDVTPSRQAPADASLALSGWRPGGVEDAVAADPRFERAR
ncbi:MAG: RecQ family ATP-dependent DNA helicase, partial [Myxococcales bacterium]|nr:RecQ family ATP-dependent DNA helicase [Myxococcales bacterium]